MHDLPPPSSEERARIRSEHAHRFPELATLRLPGDRGAVVSISTVIANPSGACDMPEGAKSMPAWSALLRAALNLAAEPGDMGAMLAADCLLYPEPAVWAGYRKRWPEINQSLAREIQNKIGGSRGTLSEPFAVDEPPALVTAALDADASRAWYYLQPRQSVRYAIALHPLTSATWRALEQKLAKRAADPWPTVRDVAVKSVAACAQEVDGEWCVVSAAGMLERFPALAAFIVGKLSDLAGATAKAELGEL